jgi:hypothetical protein
LLALVVIAFGQRDRSASAAIYPDIAAAILDVDFNVTAANTLTARGPITFMGQENLAGLALERTGDFPQESLWSGVFLLQAALDGAGQLLPGGTLTITSIMDSGMSSEVLPVGPILLGDVTSFAYGPGAADSTVFDLDISVTGGILQGDFPAAHATIRANFGPWDFAAMDDPTFGVVLGSANVFATVPEPASVVAWGLLGLGFSSVLLRRKRIGMS